MNRSKLFLFSIISTSIISFSSAMEPTTTGSEKDLVAQPQNRLSLQQIQRTIIEYTPVINRLAKGEPGYRIALDGLDNIVAVLESGRQGYLQARQICHNITTSPITQAVVTNAQIGAQIAVNSAYSVGTHVAHYLADAYRQQTEGKQLSFHEAHTAFKTNMPSIVDLSQQEACKKTISESLVIIRNGIPSVGVRTAAIDSIIEKINSETNSITQEYIHDSIDAINEIVKLSKTEDGQNILDASTVQQPASLEIDNEEILLSQLLSQAEESEKSVIKNNVLSYFVKTYMQDDVNIQTILENKRNEIDAAILKQLIPALKLFKNDMERAAQVAELQQLETEISVIDKSRLIAELIQEKDKLRDASAQESEAMQRLDSIINQLDTENNQLKQQLKQQQDNDSLKEQLNNATSWNRVKNFSLTGLTAALILLILHYKTHIFDQLLDHIPSYFNK